MFEITQIERKLTELFANNFNLEVPGVDTDLLASGLLDSLMLVELLLHLEQDFGVAVSVDDMELDHFRTIANIAELVSGTRETALAA